MNIALWIISGLLAAGFLASGATKLTQPKEKLVASTGVLEDFSAGSIKAIGILEILAAVGLILPAALDIAPVLVPLAAGGLVLLMAGAIHHARPPSRDSGNRGDASFCSPLPSSWRPAASAHSPSPADPAPRLGSGAAAQRCAGSTGPVESLITCRSRTPGGTHTPPAVAKPAGDHPARRSARPSIATRPAH